MNKKFSVLIKNKIKKFNKVVKIPGDKSCSIRSMLLASQCIGISKIKNLLESEDVLTGINTLKKSAPTLFAWNSSASLTASKTNLEFLVKSLLLSSLISEGPPLLLTCMSTNI